MYTMKYKSTNVARCITIFLRDRRRRRKMIIYDYDGTRIVIVQYTVCTLYNIIRYYLHTLASVIE